MKQLNHVAYPVVLEVDHVAEILGVSKRIAHEIMNAPGFPLIRLGERLKRVQREAFFAWLDNQAC